MRSQEPAFHFDERFLPCLMAHSHRNPSLSGIVEALGTYRRPELIPLFLSCLAEDFAYQQAEAALTAIGRPAIGPLLRLAREVGEGSNEFESHRRARRRAITLLRSIGGINAALVGPLIDDRDPHIALDACAILLAVGPSKWRKSSLRRVRLLTEDAGWMVRRDAATLLAASSSGGPSRAGQTAAPKCGAARSST